MPLQPYCGYNLFICTPASHVDDSLNIPAYSIIADPGESDESDFDSSDDSNDEGFFPDEAKKHALEKERKRKIKEAVNKAMNR